jgi:uncharacterized protein (TIGR03435 family)
MLRCTNATLNMLMFQAYDVQSYQINGPAWFDSEHFDITAKIPAGATKEQFRLMLQNLLAERFQVKLHRETRQLPIYALLVGKAGPKMKPSADLPPQEDPPKEMPDLPPPPPKPGPDGLPPIPKGRAGGFMMFMNGRFRMAGSQQTMADLARMLSNQLGRPVIDQTGLKGKYDFTLDFTPEPGRGMPGGMPMPMPPPGGGGGGGPMTAGSAGENQERDSAPSLFVALPEQLGLKLESRKGPVEFLVIDHAEKVPTEN